MNATHADNPFAAAWHTALVVAALGVKAYFGWRNAEQMRQAATVSHFMLYSRAISGEWIMLAVVLAGMWMHKTPLRAVLGERWSATVWWKDVGIALGFVVVSVLYTSVMGAHDHHAGTDAAVRFLMPQTVGEKWLWVVVCVSAGICEETVYRGYLQHQFMVWTRSVPVGIVIAAVIFGVSHAYQGWKPAALIAGGGVMSGALAQWRKSLRPGMIAHALQDMLAIVVSH